MIPLIALGVLTTASLHAQVSDAIAFAHFRMRMARSQASLFPPPLPAQEPSAYPAGLESYVLIWSSFNEGTLERDLHIGAARDHLTLKDKLVALDHHQGTRGLDYPIIYFRVLFYGDRYAHVQTDWMTNVPRGEDLYFERR